jgi:hypothetical protein
MRKLTSQLLLKESKMKVLKSIIFTVVLSTLISSAIYADEKLSGAISNIASIPAGLLVRLDTGVPPECEGTPYGWMLVEEENISMVSVVLTMWAMENRNVTLYTKPYTGGGYCEVVQVAPSF